MSELKLCLDCHHELPMTLFWLTKRGPYTYCKPCSLERAKRWRHQNPELASVGQRRRYAENPALFKARASRWSKENPERARLSKNAVAAVGHAVSVGRLIRPSSCEACGKTGPVDGAHSDYTRPLDVRWLCRRCHAIWDHQIPKTLLPENIDVRPRQPFVSHDPRRSFS